MNGLSSDSVQTRFRCPRCGAGVLAGDRWRCTESCGAIWHTFRTDGVCPGCGRRWSEAQCACCGAWSSHEAWRSDDATRGPERLAGPTERSRCVVRPFEPIRSEHRHPSIAGVEGRFVGRADELLRALAILGRRRGGGLLVVGEEGVGKTALVDEISRVVASGDARAGSLAGAVFQAIEIDTLAAGRPGDPPSLREAVERASIESGTILVIEHLHRAVAADPEVLEVVGRLGVRTLATTDPEGHRALLHRSPSLEVRLGAAMTLPSLGPREAIVAALVARPSIEIRHGVRIAHSAVVEAVGRCVATSRPLPGAAIDLLDAAAARLRVERQMRPDAIAASRRRRERLALERDSIATDRRGDAAVRIERSIAEQDRHLAELETRLTEELREIDALVAMRRRLGDLRLETRRFGGGIDDARQGPAATAAAPLPHR